MKTYVGGDREGWGVIGTKAVWWGREKRRAYGEGWGTGDRVEVKVDRKKREMSFAVIGKDGIVKDYGPAFKDLPANGDIYPTVGMYQKDDEVEILVSGGGGEGVGEWIKKVKDGCGNGSDVKDWFRENVINGLLTGIWRFGEGVDEGVGMKIIEGLKGLEKLKVEETGMSGKWEIKRTVTTIGSLISRVRRREENEEVIKETFVFEEDAGRLKGKNPYISGSNISGFIEPGSFGSYCRFKTGSNMLWEGVVCGGVFEGKVRSDEERRLERREGWNEAKIGAERSEGWSEATAKNYVAALHN